MTNGSIGADDPRIEQGLSVYVVTNQPLARVAEQLRTRAKRRRAELLSPLIPHG